MNHTMSRPSSTGVGTGTFRSVSRDQRPSCGTGTDARGLPARRWDGALASDAGIPCPETETVRRIEHLSIKA